MAWQKELDEISRRHRLAEEMGGPELVAREHAKGKLTVRERVKALADSGSFQEIGSLAGKATYDGDNLLSVLPSPTITGICSLAGHRVAISADDATVRDEVPGTEVGYKMSNAQKLALDWHIPLVRLLDDFDGSVLEIKRVRRNYTPDVDAATEAIRLLDIVPVVSAVMGEVEGYHAIEACLCHFNVMVKGTGRLFLADPSESRESQGQATTEEELGGFRMHAYRSGVVDNVAENEEEAFKIIRRFLSYLPDNVWKMAPRTEPDDDPKRRDEELLSIIPEAKNKLYDPYEILERVLDRDSIFEIAPFHGHSSITALARVNGYPVGVMAKNPMSDTVGALDVAAGEKIIRFWRLCDTFHLPLVYFVDEPGFMVGIEEQKRAVARAGTRVVTVGVRTRMPWINFVTRQLYGVAGCIAFRHDGMGKIYGWATANWGGMHLEGGTSAAYRRVIDSAHDPEAKRKEIESSLMMLSSIFRTAEAFEVEDIIDPRDTRALLCDFVEAAQEVLKTQLGPDSSALYEP